MPFDLIPPEKKKKKKESLMGVLSLKKSKDPKKFLYFAIFVGGIILVFVLYFVIKGYKSSLEHRIADLDFQIKRTEKEKLTLRQHSKAGDFQTRLNILSDLIHHHIFWSHFFPLLEEATLSQIQFTSFSADASSQNLALNGVALSFDKLAEQMIALRSKEWVRELKLTSLSITEEGIKFNFKLQLSPKVWQIDKKHES